MYNKLVVLSVVALNYFKTLFVSNVFYIPECIQYRLKYEMKYSFILAYAAVTFEYEILF